MYFLQSSAGKIAYAVNKAYQNGWLDGLLESPVFWGIIILGGIIAIAISTSKEK